MPTAEEQSDIEEDDSEKGRLTEFDAVMALSCKLMLLLYRMMDSVQFQSCPLYT